MNTTICVTQEDINQGVRQQADSCPVAIAINKILREEYKSSCFVHAYIKNRKTEEVVLAKDVLLPDNVREFIRDFDRQHQVYPITFTLDIPKQFLRINV